MHGQWAVIVLQAAGDTAAEFSHVVYGNVQGVIVKK